MGKNRFKIMIAIGAVFLAFYFLTPNYTPTLDRALYSPAPDLALEMRCRAAISQRGGSTLNLIERCKERAFATAITAEDASSAHGVSNSNQTEILIHIATMFTLGLGGILMVFGLLGLFGIIKPRQGRS